MPELRKDPVSSRWVIISTERGRRPSDFGTERERERVGFCPFCPGNEDKTPPEVLAYRPNGSGPNAPGWNLRVVPNKFAALQIEGDLNRQGDGMYDKMNGIGAHEVVIETPEHGDTFASMGDQRIEDVLWAFHDRVLDLRKDPRFKYILIFKNAGRAAGASLEHPHSQLIATPIIPKRVREEWDGAKEYYNYKERCVFCDIVRQELNQEIRLISVEGGKFFTEGDNEARRRVAVIGSAVPDLFGVNGVAMVGQEIQIRGISFTVLGMTKSKGSQGGFMNPDEQIWIPLLTARYRVHGTDRIRNMNVKVASPGEMNVAMIEIERVLRRTHKIRPAGNNDFMIRNQADILQTVQQTTQTFTMLLAGIAAVSLLVGGIGIMNIMLVSVTERTREIGVRKALGATKGAILFQFLVEALVLCLVGGGLGVLFGGGLAIGASKVFHWNTLISPMAVFLAFFFSFAVGIFFGMWPARRAASLDPIVALRYE